MMAFAHSIELPLPGMLRSLQHIIVAIIAFFPATASAANADASDGLFKFQQQLMKTMHQCYN